MSILFSFFFSSRRRYTICALVTGVQTCPLPISFKVYPRATLREAAGIAGGKCNIRVVNFQTAASMQAVLDYYHTMAIRAGYTSDHRVNGNEHMLGGTKGDLASVLMMRRAGGMTDIDLVALGGRSEERRGGKESGSKG